MQIEKYTPKVTPCPFDWTDKELEGMGGYNPKTDSLARFKQVKNWVTCEDLLWNMTLAIEAGHCTDTDTFLQSFFKSRSEVERLCALMKEYGDEGFWVNDRIFTAFFALLGSDEYKAGTFDAMADALLEKSEEEFPRAKKRA